MASAFTDELQKELMSIPGAFTSIISHVPQIIGLTGAVWAMRKLTDGIDGVWGASPTSGYSGLTMSEQAFRAAEEAFSFVVKLKYCVITGLDKVDPVMMSKAAP